MHGPINNRR